MTRPTTHFVDWQTLEQQLTARQIVHRDSAASSSRRRLLTTVDEESGDIRANVRDSAAAVVQWLASVIDHDASLGPDEVVDRCLRPGPDPSRINYAAMAHEINRALDAGMTPKRLKTAIAHLRARHAAEPRTMPLPRTPVARGLAELRRALQDHHAELIADESGPHALRRRTIGMQVLATVRCAAGRLIENDYGEGIPEQIDLDELEGAYLDFVRQRRHAAPSDQPDARPDDLHRLLLTICHYEPSVEYDMRLVLDGNRVVAALLGPTSLPGLLGELNVLVAGRALLDSRTYLAELLRLAGAAARLHDDADTRRLVQWNRRRPDAVGLPSPLRLRSYCLNNACTHVLERLHRSELPDAARWLRRASSLFDRMAGRDSGFELVQTTRVLVLTVAAEHAHDTAAIHAHFKHLGPQRSLDLIRDLYRFDNCGALCRAAEAHAVAALPALRHQLVHAG